jgi:16S rRNA (guanine527-N7)-methyltransferase
VIWVAQIDQNGPVSGRDLEVRIRARLKRVRLATDDHRLAQLAVYFGLLTKWNKTISLSGLTLDPPSDESLDRLLVEPVLAAQFIGKDRAAGQLLDLGSGGGSPAIPLKIALPALKLRMVEAKTRKSAFLREVVRALSLTDAEVLNARMEELLARPDLNEVAMRCPFGPCGRPGS